MKRKFFTFLLFVLMSAGFLFLFKIDTYAACPAGKHFVAGAQTTQCESGSLYNWSEYSRRGTCCAHCDENTESFMKYYVVPYTCVLNNSPTVTPGGPSVTPQPLPTVNPLCTCNTTGSCSTQCVFNKRAGITTYNNPIKCNVVATFFTTTPSAANKKDWCRRPNKTKGDANGDDKITLLDYFYFVSARFGGKVPPNINPDFNGDRQINNEDAVIIRQAL